VRAPASRGSAGHGLMTQVPWRNTENYQLMPKDWVTRLFTFLCVVLLSLILVWLIMIIGTEMVLWASRSW